MIVETETAVYILDREAELLRRFPRSEPQFVEDSPHTLPAAVAALRKDTEAIPFKLLAPLELGKPAQFLLEIRDDGVSTVRTTTDVVKLIATEDAE
jgi:hypothetical protein